VPVLSVSLCLLPPIFFSQRYTLPGMGVVIAIFLESTRTQTRVGSDSPAWGGTNLGLKRGQDSSAMHELDGVDAL
jgi:hypothetical protein